MYYARKIERAKWNNTKINCFEELNADILNSISTKDNKLSIWEVTDTEKLLDLATALNTRRDSISKIDLVIFERKTIDNNFILDKVTGETAIKSLNQYHIDLDELTLSNVLELTKMIYSQLDSDTEKNKVHHRFTKSKIEKNFVSMLNENEIDLNMCSKNLRDKYSG